MPAVFGLLTRALGWLVASSVGQWAVKALFGLGIGLAVTKIGLPQLQSYVESHASGLSSFLWQCLGAIGGDVVFTMIISSTVAAVTGNVVLKALAK